jgi:ribosomal protein L24, bacterial/organelle
MKNKVHVKKGDTVLLISGTKNKNKKDKVDPNKNRGKVLEVSPKEGKIIVEGLHKVKKHVKPRKMGDPGGIIEANAPIYACKVALICPRCNKPTRVGHKIFADGTKARQCRKCLETF